MGFDVVPHCCTNCTQFDLLPVASQAECVPERIGAQPFPAVLGDLLQLLPLRLALQEYLAVVSIQLPRFAVVPKGQLQQAGMEQLDDVPLDR